MIGEVFVPAFTDEDRVKIALQRVRPCRTRRVNQVTNEFVAVFAVIADVFVEELFVVFDDLQAEVLKDHVVDFNGQT